MSDVKPPKEYIYRYLDEVGDGSGTVDMIGDYSIVNAEFRIVAPPDKDFEIYSMLVEISAFPMDRQGYGSGAGLLGGLAVLLRERNGSGIYEDRLVLNGTPYFPVTLHYDWHRLGAEPMEDMSKIFSGGTALPLMHFQFDFVKLFGSPLILRGQHDGKLAIPAIDDFLSINMLRHRFLVRGFAYSSNYTGSGVGSPD